LAVIGVILLIFIIYFPRTIQVGIQWPEVAEILWSTFSKPLWAIGIFLITAPCLVGNQSLLNRFLSHYYFVALSKISYSSYLVHFALIQMLIYGSHQYYSLSKDFQLRIVLFISLTSFIGGFIIYLMIEKPIHNLVKKRGKIDSLKN